MDELGSILETWRGLQGRHRDAVLATVVHVSGSAYRRPGARMLIVPGGKRVGTISGGCLEGEIAQKAWWFTDSGAPVVRVYDTSSDADAVWEFGLGCDGVVQVMLERVQSESARELLQFLDARRTDCCEAVVATVVRGGAVGSRLLLGPCGVAGAALGDEVLAHAREALSRQQSRLAHVDGREVFVEWLGPPLRLVVFGAGHDAVPLVAAASQLGWRVTVADGRPAYARAVRFPGDARVVLMQGSDPLRDLDIGRETAVVMMTHNYPLDARLLPRILPREPWYLGMLGPKKRAARLFAELGLAQPESVHAPVGLDTGSDRPEAIAIAIAAEIQAARNGRGGGKLRERSAPIHHPPLEASWGDVAGVRPEFCETTIGSEA